MTPVPPVRLDCPAQPEPLACQDLSAHKVRPDWQVRWALRVQREPLALRAQQARPVQSGLPARMVTPDLPVQPGRSAQPERQVQRVSSEPLARPVPPVLWVQLAWPAPQVPKGQLDQLALPARQPERKGLKVRKDPQALPVQPVRPATPGHKASQRSVPEELLVLLARKVQPDCSPHRARSRAM